MGLMLLVALEPPKEVKEKVIAFREALSKKGITLMKAYEPHVTLFMNSFDAFESVESVVKGVADKYYPFGAAIEGILDLTNERSVDMRTVYYSIYPSKALIDLRLDLFKGLNAVRTREREEYLLSEKDKMSEKAISTVKAYGYPYGPDEPYFHVSVGSFPGSFSSEIDPEMHNYNLKMEWMIENIDIFAKLEDGAYRSVRKLPFCNTKCDCNVSKS